MTGPLAGLKVLDLSRYISGPYCAMLLADMGAEVVKVETKTGDPGRNHPPIVDGDSLYHQVFNRNKDSIIIDLRSKNGIDTLKRLIEKADIIVENFRPGTMDDMGLGWSVLHDLNPRLILGSITGFGRDGPLKDRPCFDVIAQAMTGLMSLNGAADGPPTRFGTFVTDYVSGMYAAMGILAALNARQSCGRGQQVDVSLIDSAMSLLVTAIPERLLLGRSTTRSGNRDRYGSPSSAYRTASNDWVFIAAGNSIVFPRLARAIQREDLPADPRFDTMESRLKYFDDLEPIVSQWFSNKTTAEALSVLELHDVPCARISDVDEMLDNADMEMDKRLVSVDHPKLGQVRMQGVTIHLSDTPLEVRRAAPALGENTESVLAAWLS